MTGTISSKRSWGAKRRRPMLLSFTALGVVVGLLGVAGVFATSSDRATTGQNDARSGDLPVAPVVDLELAHATGTAFNGDVTCGSDWSNDLTTGVLTSDGLVLDSLVTPDGTRTDVGYACIRNVGTIAASLSARAIDVVDSELTCAPHEAAADATCASGVGELSSQLMVVFRHVDPRATFPCGFESDEMSLHDLATDQAAPITWVQAGETQKVCMQVRWAATSATQTDRSSWRFAFDATEHECTSEADEHEPNDDHALAVPLTMPVAFSGMLCQGDVDVYRVTTGAQSVQLRVVVPAFTGGKGPLQIQVRQTNGLAVTSSYVFTPVQQVTVPANGTYLVSLVPTSSSAETTYDLSYPAS